MSASGVAPSDFAFHEYDVVSSTGIAGNAATLNDFSAATSTNPTPNGANPGSTNGTLNNAGPLGPLPGSQFVATFTVNSPNNHKFSDITVNYTIRGFHILHEGYVIRYAFIGENGEIFIRSYGEGNGLLQHQGLSGFWAPAVKSAWDQNRKSVLDSFWERRREARRAVSLTPISDLKSSSPRQPANKATQGSADIEPGSADDLRNYIRN
jgi:hypothetical protein